MTHGRRDIAGSFGADAERYDRARPRYPRALVDVVLAGLARSPSMLDVGIGTGISALAFRAAGAEVVGVEVDARMAELARARGFDVEVDRFEDWNGGGNRYDLVISGQAWHWIDPHAGAAQAARVLRPGGRLAIFWNVVNPDRDLAERFAAVYRSVPTGLPANPWQRPLLESYESMVRVAADGVGTTGRFAEPTRLDLHHPVVVNRAEWLDFVATAGGHSEIPPDQLGDLLDGLGRVIDERGGETPVDLVTVGLVADLLSRPDAPRVEP